jgi:excisionase family DNA binding protein
VHQERTRVAEAPAAEQAQKQSVSSDDRLTYTLTEAAQRLGISRALAYEAANRGELPVCRIGRRMLVPRVALARLLDEAEPPARPA